MMESRQSKGTSLPLVWQLGFLLLYAVGMSAALWCQGNAYLVLGILLLLPAAGVLARLPLAWFPPWMRQALQVMVAGCALAWCYGRMRGETIDIVLVEGVAILGFALALGGVPREYGLLGLISLLLMGYGGLTPERSIYFPLLALYLAVGTTVLYLTRTGQLAAARRSAPHPVGLRLGNWFCRSVHLLLGLALFGLLLLCFPLPYGRSMGLVPVGFHTMEGLRLMMPWHRWFGRSKESLAGQWGEIMMMDKVEDGQLDGFVRDNRADAVMSLPNEDDSMDARPGPGGSGVGTDLVMRVRSPAKLYWLTRLYDTYDGDRWTASRALIQGRRAVDRRQRPHRRRIVQIVRLEKILSSRLPAAYRAREFSWLMDRSMSREAREALTRAVIRSDLAGADVVGTPPSAPWPYRCVSLVPGTGVDVHPEARYHRRAEVAVYLRLPEARISARLRRLVRDLVGNCTTPMQKALALQRYLRENFTYRLDVAKIPAGVEAVDYFLFESRAGYCQHFAEAFTVLARLAGLPARLAVGYSPGEYNLLTSTFEVYEYHAHAWTQILIEPYGWLTFDGVAPGNLQLDSRPGFLKRFIDPFGKDWAARPPELSLVGKPKRQVSGEVLGHENATPLGKLVDKVYRKAAFDSKTASPDARAVGQAFGELLEEWFSQGWRRGLEAIATWLRELGHGFMEACRMAVRAIAGLSAPAASALLLLAAGLLLGWVKRRTLSARFRSWIKRWRFARRWRRYEADLAQAAPEEQVLLCLHMMHYALSRQTLARPVRMDMLEYAAWLSRSRRELGEACGAIAGAAAIQLYGGRLPPREDIDRALDAVKILRDEWMP